VEFNVFFSTIQSETEVCEEEEAAMSIDYLMEDHEQMPEFHDHTGHAG